MKGLPIMYLLLENYACKTVKKPKYFQIYKTVFVLRHTYVTILLKLFIFGRYVLNHQFFSNCVNPSKSFIPSHLFFISSPRKPVIHVSVASSFFLPKYFYN